MDSTESFLQYNLFFGFLISFCYFTCFHVLSNLGVAKTKPARRTVPQAFGDLSLMSHLGARWYPQPKGSPSEQTGSRAPQDEHTFQDRRGKETEGTGQDGRGGEGEGEKERRRTEISLGQYKLEKMAEGQQICQAPTLCQALCWVLGTQ